MVAIPFVGGSYTSRSTTFDAERTVNLYMEINEVGGQNPSAVLYGTPGLLKRWTLHVGTGGIRGLHRDPRTGRVFAVQSTGFVELHSDGTTTVHGTLASADGRVSMDSNDTQILIVDGQPNGGYVFTLSTDTFTTITDTDFYGADTVVYLGSYFILNRPGTAQFYQSAQNDGLTYDGLDISTADAGPDLLQGVYSDTRNLWLIGTESTEVWFNSGAPVGVSFDRIDGAILAAGAVNPRAVAILGQVVAWMGETQDGTLAVYRGDNFTLNRISTHPVEAAIGAWGALDLVYAYAYQQEGHQFFVWTHPNGTWSYDATTGLWHERQSLDHLGTLGRHRVCCHTTGFGVHLGGDYADGRVYQMDLDTYTDDGEAIVRERRLPVVVAGQRYIKHRKIELDLERGVGLDASPTVGDDPVVLMRYSDDNGKTWSSERSAAMGKQGEYTTRAIWRRLGRSRHRVYEFRISDPVKVALVGAEADVQ